MHSAQPPVAGLLLAAGAGSRHGSPKALRRGADGEPWLLRAVAALREGGCRPVIVVLGARGDEAERLLPGGDDAPAGDVVVVHAADWADGVSASLRAGLGAAAALEPVPVAVAVVPVDVPDLDAATVARLVGAWPNDESAASVGAWPNDGSAASVDAGTLRQASFDGRPGHPVVIGRGHWGPLVERLAGDTGARPYLVLHGVRMIDCGDLGTGVDVDD